MLNQVAKDLFSKQAADYARYRPGYPAELIEYVIGFVPEKQLAWDCATGNGQAAVLLAAHFKKVMATDSSEKQLSLAVSKENIVYQACRAEQTPFADNSFDLVTIAQAYHWFQFNDFEKEVRRVAKTGAVIAAWGYNLPACSHQEIDTLILHFYTSIVGAYWDAERKYVEEKYATVPFNFDILPSKTFSIDVQWSREDVAGYLNSWSSVQHFIKANNYNPVNKMATELAAVWPKEHTDITFTFPIFCKTGRIIK
jgi:ubiquinone/menaquinone biosynthesis C-methylase UbiE